MGRAAEDDAGAPDEWPARPHSPPLDNEGRNGYPCTGLTVV